MPKHLLGLFICLTSINTQAQKLIKEFTPGSNSSFFYFMGNTQNGFIMSVYDPFTGLEPWVSDGTTKGTVMLQDINPGTTNSIFNNEAFSNDTLLYFFAYRGVGNNFNGLWRTDGTISGTYFIDSMEYIYPSKYYGDATFYKGEFYYFTSSSSYKTLYATDGSRNKPRKIYSFKDSNYASRSNLRIFNDRLYFYGNDAEHGVELWSTDGSSAGTKMVYDLNAGPGKSMYINGQLISCRDKLFFTAMRDYKEGYELFYITTQSDEPVLFKDYTPVNNASSYISLIEGNDSFFLFNVMNTNPPETYVSDGTLKNTGKFHDPIVPDPDPYYYTYGVHRTKNFTMVSSYTNNTGLEFFKSNQQLRNMGLLRDINPGIGSSINGNISKIFEVDGKAYFLGFNFMLGNDIWVTDGTTDSTIIYFEFPNNNQNTSDILHQWKNRLFFCETIDFSIGTELYELNIRRNTSIDPKNINNSAVYPNPVSVGQTLTISNQACQFELHNTLGQIVWKGESQDGLTSLPDHIDRGIYYLLITTDSDRQPTTLLVQ